MVVAAAGGVGAVGGLGGRTSGSGGGGGRSGAWYGAPGGGSESIRLNSGAARPDTRSEDGWAVALGREEILHANRKGIQQNQVDSRTYEGIGLADAGSHKKN